MRVETFLGVNCAFKWKIRISDVTIEDSVLVSIVDLSKCTKTDLKSICYLLRGLDPWNDFFAVLFPVKIGAK